MTRKEFVEEIEGCYGNYNPEQKDMVGKWLSYFHESKLQILFWQILESISWMDNHRPPGLKEFEDALGILVKKMNINFTGGEDEKT